MLTSASQHCLLNNDEDDNYLRMATATGIASSANFADKKSERTSRINQLLTIRKSITSFFRGKSDELHSIRECRTVSVDCILEFAKYTTFTLRAPEGWTPGMPLIGGHPPAPQPDQMRDGVLQRYNQRCPINIVQPLLRPHTELRDIVRVENIAKSLVSTEKISLKTTRPETVETIISVSVEEVKETITSPVDPVVVSIPMKVVEDQQPHKRARQINISFGLSDSESSEEEG